MKVRLLVIVKVVYNIYIIEYIANIRKYIYEVN
jgi:hypothetical protein